MSKQDMTAARTAADIERKYNFGQTFGEIIGLANAAQRTADEAKEEASASQTAAEEAIAAAELAKAEAETAKAEADKAASEALAAQTAADLAQAAADNAELELAEAKQDLADVTSRVDATEEEIATAQAAVTTAQETADKATADAQAAQETADTAKAEAETAQNAANVAQNAADTAQAAVDALNTRLDGEEIFNRLTNNGTLQGLYRGDDGELYINATYIKTGEILADLIKSGKITSKDGKVVIDLSGASGFTTNSLAVKANADDTINLFRVFVLTNENGESCSEMYLTSSTGKTVLKAAGGSDGGGLTMYSEDGWNIAGVSAGNDLVDLSVTCWNDDKTKIALGGIYSQKEYGEVYINLDTDRINGKDISDYENPESYDDISISKINGTDIADYQNPDFSNSVFITRTAWTQNYTTEAGIGNGTTRLKVTVEKNCLTKTFRLFGSARFDNMGSSESNWIVIPWNAVYAFLSPSVIGGGDSISNITKAEGSWWGNTSNWGPVQYGTYCLMEGSGFSFGRFYTDGGAMGGWPLKYLQDNFVDQTVFFDIVGKYTPA